MSSACWLDPAVHIGDDPGLDPGPALGVPGVWPGPAVALTEPANRRAGAAHGARLRRMTLAKTVLVPAAAVALVASGVGMGWSAAADDPEPVVVVRELLAQDVAPRGAPDRTLGLNRVTVMPGARLASHHHPGTQIAYVESGVLTYTVETSSAVVRTGPSDRPRVVRRVKAGQTARLRAGHWIVEQPRMTHHAANRGTTPVVLYISTLFRTGAPAAIPD